MKLGAMATIKGNKSDYKEVEWYLRFNTKGSKKNK